PQAERLLGHSAERWRAEPGFWQGQIADPDREGAVALCRKAARDRAEQSFACRTRAADGRTGWLHVGVSAGPGSGGGVRLRGIMVDITDQKKLEEQLLRAQRMEAVGHLAGGVAHDFNNLLTVIGGYSDLLLDTLPAQDFSRGLVEEIHSASQRAASLTR